jgi:uncharacterized Tic20 family protein
MAESKDRTMAILAHALAIVVGFIGPLVIYLIAKDDEFAADQAKESLNFQITVLIAIIISSILIVVVIGAFLLWAVGIANTILCILAAVAASNGQKYRYPVTIRFIK